VTTVVVGAPRYTQGMDGARGALVRRAASGDQAAWGLLVQRYNSMVWSIVRSFRLSPDDALDAVQTIWLRLVENLGRIKEPEAVGTWLATTARNECLGQLRRRGRQAVPVDTAAREVVDVRAALGDEAMLVRERDTALWAALSRVSERCQQLLRILAADPPPSYEEVGAVLGMPMGSIGPTRARCLEKLRQTIAAKPHPNDLLSSP
jgi:RNA polymerase sigma factor (sigma-70 family)